MLPFFEQSLRFLQEQLDDSRLVIQMLFGKVSGIAHSLLSGFCDISFGLEQLSNVHSLTPPHISPDAPV